MSFGDKLKELRDARGMTQEQLAGCIGVSKTTVTGYERGNREPDVRKIRLLAAALEVSCDELLDTGVPGWSLSEDAEAVAREYDTLDSHGRAAVRGLLEEELNRMAALTALTEPEPRVINLYLEPSAAGLAVPAAGTDYLPLELKEGDPQDAAYAVRLQGDSMEPFFPDGSTVFVNHDALRDGEIGIFCVDGGTVCKQYHYDGALGITYLFSLNRKRADCDVVLPADSGRSLVCQGRVITRRHYPLPGK